MVLCEAKTGPLKLVSTLQMEKDLLHALTVAIAQIFSMQLEATYVTNKETIIGEMPDELQKLLTIMKVYSLKQKACHH